MILNAMTSPSGIQGINLLQGFRTVNRPLRNPHHIPLKREGSLCIDKELTFVELKMQNAGILSLYPPTVEWIGDQPAPVTIKRQGGRDIFPDSINTPKP
jgi:hypothetical protein